MLSSAGTSAPSKQPHTVWRGSHARRPSTRQAASSASTISSDDDGGLRPTRGVLILPGLGNNAADYLPLAKALSSRNVAVAVAPIERIDWSRNAAALTDGNWWRGTLKPRPAVDWYLTRTDAAMQELKSRVDGAPITILAHSAGGWLGRVYLHDFGTEGVDRFVSLGSPHNPPPEGAEGVVDQTRGILTYCQQTFPGAFHNQITYTTVAGRFVKGMPLAGEGSLLAKFAGAGYQQVCGEAEVWGDFICPEPAAHLEGALNVNLEGVFHSPLGEKLSFFGPWYGSEQVLPQWVHLLSGASPSAEAEAAVAAARTEGGRS